METHFIKEENRERLIINEVVDVDAFDENNLWANIKEGAVEVSGEKLIVEKLDLEEGILIVKGKINSFSYVGQKPYSKNSVIKMFRKKD